MENVKKSVREERYKQQRIRMKCTRANRKLKKRGLYSVYKYGETRRVKGEQVKTLKYN